MEVKFKNELKQTRIDSIVIRNESFNIFKLIRPVQ